MPALKLPNGNEPADFGVTRFSFPELRALKRSGERELELHGKQEAGVLAETFSALGSNVAVVFASLVVAVCSFHNNWQLTNVLWVLIWLLVLLARVMDRVLWAAVAKKERGREDIAVLWNLVPLNL